jgi:hypothetical protein
VKVEPETRRDPSRWMRAIGLMPSLMKKLIEVLEKGKEVKQV